MLDEAVFFQIGSLSLPGHGLFIMFGAIAFVLAVIILFKLKKLSPDAAPVFCALALPMALICSRLLFCALDEGFSLRFSITALVSFWGGGYSMVGAMIGVLFAALIARKILHVSLFSLLDCVAPAFLLFVFFERLGEQYTELLGRSRPLVSSFWQLGFFVTGDEYTLYLKTYLLEAIAALILFVIMTVILFRQKDEGDTTLIWMLVFGCTQLLLESLRFDSHMCETFVKLQMVLYAVLFIWGCVLCAKRMARKKHTLRPIVLAVLIPLAVVGCCVGIEFAIDRSDINKILLYIPYILLVSVPCILGIHYLKGSKKP